MEARFVVGFPDVDPVTEYVARDLDGVNEVVPVCVDRNVGPDWVGVREVVLVDDTHVVTEPLTLVVRMVVPEGLGDRVARNVGPDCVGLKDPDLVTVEHGDTEPRLTVKAAEGVATLAEPVGEMVTAPEPVPSVPVI